MSDLFTTGTGYATSQGQATWQTRLRAEIRLTAPDKTVYTAAWVGDEIEGQKRIARFELPGVQGTQVQDLGAGGLLYPLTLHFAGLAHDIDAKQFLDALCAQAGIWTVIHPIYGSLELQPVGAKLRAMPLESGGITVVETQWLEPGPAATKIAVAVAQADVRAVASGVDKDAAAQFEALAETVDPAATAALVSQGQRALTTIQASPLSSLAARVGSIRATADTLYQQVLSALTAPVLDLAAIAGGIQQIITLPAAIVGDVTARLDAYSSMIMGIIEGFVPGADEESRTSTVMAELVLTSGITGMARVAATSTPDTREQAVQVMAVVAAVLTTVTTALDAAQELQAGAYFSHSQTHCGLMRLVGLVQSLMLRLLFDLRIAKRFTLDRPRSPVEIVITEYGRLGDEDEYLDFFLLTNGLLDRDVLLLPAGREVIVYKEPGSA